MRVRAILCAPALLGVGALAGSAGASWGLTTRGPAMTVRAASFTAASAPRVDAEPGGILVTWGAVALTGDDDRRATSYVVRRHGVPGDAGVVVTCAGEAAPLQCLDAGAGALPVTYTVAPVYRGWLGPDSPPSPAVPSLVP